VVVTRPKSAAPPPSFVPIQVLSAPDVSGDTVARNPTGSATGIEAGPPYRAYSNATGVRAWSYYHRTYSVGTGDAQVNGSSMAVRGPFSFPLLPTRNGNTLTFLAILDSSDRYMGFLRVTNSGAVQLVGRNAAGRDRVASGAINGLSPSDVADCELIVGGGNTTRGRVSLIASVGDEPREEIANVENLDFTGRVPRQRRFLGVSEKDTAGRWDVTVPWLRVTSSGDVVEEFGDVPDLPPDRPMGADGAYREISTLDEAGEEPEDLPIHQLYIHVPPGFDDGTEYGAAFDDFYLPPEGSGTFAIYARWEDLAVQPGRTFRLRVFDENGDAWEPSAAGWVSEPSGTSTGWQEPVGVFTPPAGFFRGRLEVIRTGSGMLIVQEPICSDGVI
jgi:hypothetical protein